MRLLVSVTNAAEASDAIAGGADIIDAKDVLAGALGAVTTTVFREIHAMVSGSRLVSAALGDAADEASVERDAAAFSTAGAAWVKVGFAAIASPARVAALIRAAVSGAGASAGKSRSGDVVAVAYADADRMASLPPETLLAIAAREGAKALLVDTADKNGPGLCALVPPADLATLVTRAHQTGLLVALAGKLKADDLPVLRDIGADIAGVRGAACDNGRTGRISADRVRVLHALCAPPEAARNYTRRSSAGSGQSSMQRR
jgi:(5-formylfuran-3-yl)methyl phosphate synthase